MKRFLCFFLVSLLLLCALPLASSAKEPPTVTLNVYNWGQYIADGEDDLPDTNELFEEYFNGFLAEKYGYMISVNQLGQCNLLDEGSAVADLLFDPTEE